MSIDVFFSNVQSFAAFITAITIIGGAFIWIYQKTIGKAKERKEEERNEAFRQKIEESNKPLIRTLESLNESMEARKQHDDKLDRVAEQNSEILKKHEERLDNHDDTFNQHNERLVVLEVKGGVRKLGYVEKEEEEKS